MFVGERGAFQSKKLFFRNKKLPYLRRLDVSSEVLSRFSELCSMYPSKSRTRWFPDRIVQLSLYSASYCQVSPGTEEIEKYSTNRANPCSGGFWYNCCRTLKTMYENSAEFLLLSIPCHHSSPPQKQPEKNYILQTGTNAYTRLCYKIYCLTALSSSKTQIW